MSAEEIVRGLLEMLPPKVDYAKLVCAEGFAHGQCYVWDDPEPYIISEAADLIGSLTAQLAASQQRERAAVEDLKVMALAMRESEELSEGCCFACAYDAQNLPDNVILAYGECPGYDTDECFEWRGPSGGKD